MEVTTRTYTLDQITGAMGDALKALPASERLKAERTLFLFVDAVVDRLKSAAEPTSGAMLADAIARALC